MYNLLIVDDEFFAVEAIKGSIVWEEVNIVNIFEASDVEEAKQCLLSNKVDIIICDIEMPGEDGLSLLKWTQTQLLDVETIMLTGHADFKYAQSAIHNGTFDYVLKPIQFEELKAIIKKAAAKLAEDREVKKFNQVYKKYHQLWEANRPLLIESFWKDLLEQKFVKLTQLSLIMESYNLEIDPECHVIPILISIEEWHKELSVRDEEIMEYALRNAAAEIFFPNQNGTCIQDRNGVIIILLFNDRKTIRSPKEIEQKCKQFIQACNAYFFCNLSCYVGSCLPLLNLAATYEDLLQMERNNVVLTNHIFHLKESSDRASQLVTIPWYSDLSVLFESRKRDDLYRKMEEIFQSMNHKDISYESLDAFYHTLLHYIYHVFHTRGISTKDVYGQGSHKEFASATRSVSNLKQWAFKILEEGMIYLDLQDSHHSSIKEKIHLFVLNHLHENVSREDIASYVNFNSAYLSRLFKKEVGLTLSDYIAQLRIDKAKSLLTESSLKISIISERVGYYNFSHFTKVFKKATSQTPQEYRKQFKQQPAMDLKSQ
jgi:two-component system response regulator YesN